ncbi:Pls/PosA family non-ribosomal peptide synthetase [Telmatospirillum sp.]|uniref:Pls/PosA family non-ribosomal peptide synthetase n=1 Tax=Telmatospirillum sp. TaxID=2079197 RepID=UPI00284A17D7|nr:Pls/PosA family non-ribosomal peptide synthetase [Telmatospirillum sp.]MDR3441121.1 amino acid adenylation domain-containing protein [Telmatospirillum sp.]
MNQIIPSVLPESMSGSLPSCLLRDELLPEIFAATVERAANRPAAECGGQLLTYAMLDQRANRVARSLRARGIGRGCFVGLWMERSLDLHVALLGILKAGAAYLPFDADVPAERVRACLTDCSAKAVLLDAATAERAGEQPAVSLLFSELLDGASSEEAFDLRGEGARPADPAYVIYTSGSTGKPKGVVISHRNICHYLRAANSVYGIVETDVVFQGASVAFDLSLEEIFIPYLVGAKLWIATRQTLQETDRLSATLISAGITVLDTVPTLLSMLSERVDHLRIIILGGETCPPALAERWCRPGRRLFNSYGPTEATVVATIAELRPGQPVTIGRPIPNYTCYVVDEQLNQVAPGVEGELLIGGPGVAAGYLNRPELTAQKFIDNPFRANGSDPVLYRSGDAVSFAADGSLQFHGRIDDQVKIRGFRVELGEIEAKLTHCAGVSQAAVVLRTDDGTDRLVAFLVADAGSAAQAPAAQHLREALRAELPAYMVPGHFEWLQVLPRLISGKTDRKALQSRPLTAVETEEQEAPKTSTEAVLLAAVQKVFPRQAIPLDADFFTDLGGHSLLAARFVSAVRETPALAGLTLQDVYAARSVRAMAARLDERIGRQTGDDQPQRSLAFEPPPLLRRFLCGLAQAVALPVILAMITASWLGVFVAYELFSGEEHNFFRETTALLTTYGVINIVTTVIAIAAKWLIIGRAKPGVYPLWGVYYYRWWLSQRFVSMVHFKWFQGTPIMRMILRLLGAKVGKDAMICDFEAGALDLITIGKGATVGGKTQFANAEVIGDKLVIGHIDVGNDAYVGTSCVIGHDCVIGEGAELADLTALPAGVRVGAWEIWEGSPARATGHVDQAALPAASTAGPLLQGVQALIYAAMLVVLPPITLIPIIPAFYLFDNLSDVFTSTFSINYLYILPLLSWPTAMALILITVVLIAAVRWIVLPRVVAGTYSVHSWFYLRKWVVALATELTLETLSSLYATVYMRNWYRLMGAKIGKDAEISTNLAGRYDLTDIGEKCFIADEVVLGDEDIRRGWMFLKQVKTGARVFVGNDAVVPAGADIPEGSLIGIKSRPPAHDVVMQPGDIWFGSPPIKLPVRQRFDNVVSANWTFEPSRWRRLGRALFEAHSVSLPTMLFITFGTLAVELLAPSVIDRDYGTLLPLFVACSVAISAALVLSAVLVKWLMMGAYKPTVKPMWSWWALRTEAVAVMYWGMAGKVMLDHLRGTPFLPWALRLFGCKFGQGIFMDTTDITEFDCVTVGDFSAINDVAALQTHLYEDRVMKVGRVTLGRGVTIGGGATVLYDTHVGDFARIGQLSIIMKGEEIPANSAWYGAPAQTMLHPMADTAPALSPSGV